MAKIIIVNDGVCRWGADATKLLTYLTSHGWEIDGARVTEPEWPGPDENGDYAGVFPYDALCQDVQPAPGYGVEDDSDAWDALPNMTAWPSDGQGVWVLTDA